MKNPQFRGCCWTKVLLTVEMSASCQQSSFPPMSYKLKVIVSHSNQKSIGFRINTHGIQIPTMFLMSSVASRRFLHLHEHPVLCANNGVRFSGRTKESRAGEALGTYESALQWQLTFITWCNKPHPWHYENVVVINEKVGIFEYFNLKCLPEELKRHAPGGAS